MSLVVMAEWSLTDLDLHGPLCLYDRARGGTVKRKTGWSCPLPQLQLQVQSKTPRLSLTYYDMVPYVAFIQ